MAVSKYSLKFPTGSKVKEWTVIGEPVMDNRSRAKIPVRCSCGEETEVYAYHLAKGNSTKCKKCSTGQSPDEYGLRYRSSLTLDTKVYSLSATNLSESFSQQNGTCIVSGEPLKWEDAAVVRYKNDEGYTPDNVCLVSQTVSNRMDGMSVQEYYTYCSNAMKNIEKTNPVQDFFDRREKNDT